MLNKLKNLVMDRMVTTLLRVSGLVIAALGLIGLLTGHWGHVITLLLGVSLVLFEE